MTEYYKSEASLKNAIKRQGMHLMNYEIKYVSGNEYGWTAVFYVHDAEDFREVTKRGFNALINTEKAA
jgi:hypothetical protein